MEELKRMMRRMAEKLHDEAEKLGMENFNLSISYTKVSDELGYEIFSIDCTKRTHDIWMEPEWVFQQSKYRNDHLDEGWMDSTRQLNGLSDEETAVEE